MYGLVLEGIYGAGKSSIMAALKKKAVELDSDSCIFFSEVFTQRLKEHEGKEDPVSALAPMSSIANALRELAHLYAASPISQDKRRKIFSLSYLLESCHFNAAVRYGLDWKAVDPIDQALSQAGAKVVFLKIPKDVIRERSVITTKETRDPEWATYLENRYGRDEDEVARRFSQMQDRMEELLSKSRMPISIIETETMNWDEISQNIFNAWAS